MGRSNSSTPPPPPKTPPPPAEDVSAEVIAPTMRQEAARRARMGAYVTRGQKIGSGGQLLGAAPIQLANVAAAAQAAKGEKMPEEKTLQSLNPLLTAEIKKTKGTHRGIRTHKYKELVQKRKSLYEKYMSERKKKLSTPRKPISPEGGMVI